MLRMGAARHGSELQVGSDVAATVVQPIATVERPKSMAVHGAVGAYIALMTYDHTARVTRGEPSRRL
jgi:hypothetical protein